MLVVPTPLNALRVEVTAEGQLCNLVDGDDRQVFTVEKAPLVPATTVPFVAEGFERLAIGLRRAGLDPSTLVVHPASGWLWR